MRYPEFFDDHDDKQAFWKPLMQYGLPYLSQLAGKAWSSGLPAARAWSSNLSQGLARQAARQVPAAAQAATGAAAPGWGRWGWNAAKQVGGMAGVTLGANALLGGLGLDGSAAGSGSTDTASMELLQAAYNHPDPRYRQYAQQYLAQTFGMNPAAFQQQPQQSQDVGDMTLNGLAQQFGSGMTPSPQSSSPFYQPPAAAQQQVRTVYVPMMPQGYQQPQAAQPQQAAARPAVGQPPAPAARAPQVAARPAAGQPPAPAPAAAPRQMAAAPRPQPSGVAPQVKPPTTSIMTPPPKPVPAAFANMPTATASIPWFFRSKEATAGGSSFFRKDS